VRKKYKLRRANGSERSADLPVAVSQAFQPADAGRFVVRPAVSDAAADRMSAISDWKVAATCNGCDFSRPSGLV